MSLRCSRMRHREDQCKSKRSIFQCIGVDLQFLPQDVLLRMWPENENVIKIFICHYRIISFKMMTGIILPGFLGIVDGCCCFYPFYQFLSVLSSFALIMETDEDGRMSVSTCCLHIGTKWNISILHNKPHRAMQFCSQSLSWGGQQRHWKTSFRKKMNDLFMTGLGMHATSRLHKGHG